MAEALLLASLAGTGLEVIGKLQQGQYEEAAYEYQARELEAKGKRQFAEGQREALEEKRKTDDQLSRQIAVAAASGAGVETPSVLDIYEDTARRGKYHEDVARYRGESAKAGSIASANASRFKGKAAKDGSLFDAAGTALTGIGKAAKAYG